MIKSSEIQKIANADKVRDSQIEKDRIGGKKVSLWCYFMHPFKDGIIEREELLNLQKNTNIMRKNFGVKAWTYPQPVFIIGSYSEDGTPDAMNAAWCGISEEKPDFTLPKRRAQNDQEHLGP